MTRKRSVRGIFVSNPSVIAVLPLGDECGWKILLGEGKFAFLSSQDRELASPHAWRLIHGTHTDYAQTQVRQPDGSYVSVLLHQLIGQAMGIEGPVDHKNRDGLDNQRTNLRPGPATLNAANKIKMQTRATSSAYKGVSWCPLHKKWRVTLRVNGKKRHLGYFAAESEAARAYDRAALQAWGEYARPNFPQEVACA